MGSKVNNVCPRRMEGPFSEMYPLKQVPLHPWFDMLYVRKNITTQLGIIKEQPALQELHDLLVNLKIQVDSLLAFEEIEKGIWSELTSCMGYIEQELNSIRMKFIESKQPDLLLVLQKIFYSFHSQENLAEIQRNQYSMDTRTVYAAAVCSNLFVMFEDFMADLQIISEVPSGQRCWSLITEKETIDIIKGTKNLKVKIEDPIMILAFYKMHVPFVGLSKVFGTFYRKWEQLTMPELKRACATLFDKGSDGVKTIQNKVIPYLLQDRCCNDKLDELREVVRMCYTIYFIDGSAEKYTSSTKLVTDILYFIAATLRQITQRRITKQEMEIEPAFRLFKMMLEKLPFRSVLENSKNNHEILDVMSLLEDCSKMFQHIENLVLSNRAIKNNFSFRYCTSVSYRMFSLCAFVAGKENVHWRFSHCGYMLLTTYNGEKAKELRSRWSTQIVNNFLIEKRKDWKYCNKNSLHSTTNRAQVVSLNCGHLQCLTCMLEEDIVSDSERNAKCVECGMPLINVISETAFLLLFPKSVLLQEERFKRMSLKEAMEDI